MDGNVADPSSWNKYAYTRGDPVNRVDSGGSDDCDANSLVSCYCMVYGDVDPAACQNIPGASCQSQLIDLDPTFAAFCAEGDTGGDDPGPPPQQQPTCTISLFERGVPFGAAPWGHTYLVIDDPAEGIDDVLEGGPTKHGHFWNIHGGGYGNLVGRIEPVLAPGVTAPNGYYLGGTNPYANTELGFETGGANICDDVTLLLGWVNVYNGGDGVACAPVPNGKTTFNSNSFTYTLLYDAGLQFLFDPVVGWDPGWGQLVPGMY